MHGVVRIGCVMLGAALGAPAQAQTSPGVWTGVGFQEQGAGVQETWTVRIEVSASKVLKIDYPSLDCGGQLEPAGRDGHVRLWRERITYGPCIDGGQVATYTKDGALFLMWTDNPKAGAGLNATAVLRQDALVG